MVLRWGLLAFLTSGAWAQRIGEVKSGAPCSIQHSLKPSKKIFGPPKSIEPPFTVSIKGPDDGPVEYYEPDTEYTLEIAGQIKFRGLLVQPRLATPDGFIIGHLRGGEFVKEEEEWRLYGINFQACPPVYNNSVTHSNWAEKQVVKMKWRTSRMVGHIQFYLTLWQDAKTYWTQWQPLAGFLSPKPRFSIKGPNKGLPNIFGDKPPQEKAYPSEAAGTEAPAPSKVTRLVPSGASLLRAKSNSEEDFSHLPEVEIKAVPKDPRELLNINLKKANPQLFETPKPTTTTTTPKPTTTTPRDYCGDLLPCYNGGTCFNIHEEEESGEFDPFVESEESPSLDDGPGYVCQCADGFTGDNCLETDHCLGHKCVNGACKNNEFGYTCECYAEFAGEFCDRDCPSYLCESGGTCAIDENDEYGCICTPGTTGKRCELEVDECASNPCLFGGTCTDKFNDFSCTCSPGYMGKRCHRACQDVYKTCDLWQRQDHCVVSTHTNFFDVNCANSCGHCEYKNDTIRTTIPIPPILEPFQHFIGVWEGNSTYNLRFPYDFPHGATYHEKMTIVVTKPPMFGTPFLNYTAVATNINDPSDVKATYGFITLRTRPRFPRKVALMSTTNEGVTLVEEGPMDEKAGVLSLTPQHVIRVPGTRDIHKGRVEREFKLDGVFLRETMTRLDSHGRRSEAVKYFYRTNRFEFF